MNILLVFLGIVSQFALSAIGQLYYSELIFLALLLLLFLKRRVYVQKNIKQTLTLGLFWLLIQIVTDLTRANPFTDQIRGWAGIAFFLIDLYVLYILVAGKPQRLIFFLSGVIVGTFLRVFLQPTRFMIIEPWKFGLAIPVIFTILIVLAWVGKDHPRWLIYSVPILVAMGIMAFFLNTRTYAGLLLVTAGILWFRFTKFGRRMAGSRTKLFNLFLLGVFVFAMTYLILKGYQTVVVQGWLGEAAKSKFEMQYSPQFGVWGLLLGGRNHILGAIQAIADSPFLGYGSWARDSRYRLFVYNLDDLGYAVAGNADYFISQSDLIPAHSHLFQGWVWSGPFGAFFWFFVSFIIIQFLLRVFEMPNSLFPLFVFLGLSGLWNILFSPFGAGMRINWAYTLTALSLASSMIRVDASDLAAVSDGWLQ